MFRLRRICFSSISEGMIWNHSHFYFLCFFLCVSPIRSLFLLSLFKHLSSVFSSQGPLCFVMLVFTAFYSPVLPFIFYRRQQLGAHKKCYHFSMTNCHRFYYSLDSTCYWSPRSLYVSHSIYTASSCFTCKFPSFFLTNAPYHKFL